LKKNLKFSALLKTFVVVLVTLESGCKTRQFSSQKQTNTNEQKNFKTSWNPELLKELYLNQDLENLDQKVLRPELNIALKHLETILKQNKFTNEQSERIKQLQLSGEKLESGRITWEELAIWGLKFTCEVTNYQNLSADNTEKKVNLCQAKELSDFVNTGYVSKASERHMWLIPTWSAISLKEFNEVLAFPIFPIGITKRKQQNVDGQFANPYQFYFHDFNHFSAAASIPGTSEFFPKTPLSFTQIKTLAKSRNSQIQKMVLQIGKLHPSELDQNLFHSLLFDFLHENVGNSNTKLEVSGTDNNIESQITAEFKNYLEIVESSLEKVSKALEDKPSIHLKQILPSSSSSAFWKLLPESTLGLDTQDQSIQKEKLSKLSKQVAQYKKSLF
jgi:hypothetical protein